MPVQFKSYSEYSRQFGSTTPNEEPAAPGAGIDSNQLALTMEPPMQHKKRLDGPPTSLSTNYFNVPSKEVEFALLGQQEKFSDNVRYQPKPSFSGPKMYKNKENFDDAPPPSKQLKMQKRIKPQLKDRHPPVFPTHQRQISTSSAPLSPPPAPREPKENGDFKLALKDKDLKDVLGEPAKKDSKVTVSQQASSTHLEGRGNNMNEFVQTNMKKGITMSAPEAPAEYALKYKAGVAPQRPVKKFSEYQRQFQWKDGIKASPLLAAEEIVYKSNAELGPYKTDSLHKTSEYNQQFKQWKLPDYSNLNVNNNRSGVDDQKSDQKRTVIKRSKSAGAVLHQKQDVMEEEPEQAEDSTSEAQLKEKLKKSHGKLKRLGSEYKANFKAPMKYSYTEGAWRGAAPPQLCPQASSGEDNNVYNKNNNASEEEPLSNWFAEVLELRRRAKEYRQRAQGTHFSREHLVQLMAKQNRCWDLNSEASSTLRALNLETPAGKLSAKAKEQEVLMDATSHEATEGEEPHMSDADDSQTKEKDGKKKARTRGGKGKVGRKSRKMAWLEEQKEKVGDQRRHLQEAQQMEEAKNEDDVELGETAGRLPTPVLHGDGSARRHHLDLTTPAIGGAILTCPPSKSSKIIVTSRSGDSYVTASDDFPVNAQTKKYNLDMLMTLPAGGKPSSDTHALRDDEAASDRPLVAQYITSLPLVSGDEDKENKGQKLKKNKTGKPGNLSTIKEGYGKTFLDLDDIKANTLTSKKDDDVMSVSLMSVASSSSLASDVLERAKKRQQFWNKK